MAVIRCPKCGRAADGVTCLACGYEWGSDSAPGVVATEGATPPTPEFATPPPVSSAPVPSATVPSATFPSAPVPSAPVTPPPVTPAPAAPAPIHIPSSSPEPSPAMAANPFATPSTAAFQAPKASEVKPPPPNPVTSSPTSLTTVTAPAPVSSPMLTSPGSARDALDQAATVPFFESPAHRAPPVQGPSSSAAPSSSSGAGAPVTVVSGTIRTCDECGQVMSQQQSACLVCGWVPGSNGASTPQDDPFRDVLFGAQPATGSHPVETVPDGNPTPTPKVRIPIPSLPKGPQGAVAAQTGFVATSPLFYVAAAAVGFFGVFLLGGIVLLLVWGPGEVDLAKAGETVRTLSQKPDRTALDYLQLGHANASLSDVVNALSAYRSAADKGSVDARSIAYAFAHLGDPLQGKQAGLFLAEVFQDDVTEKLIESVDSGDLNTRRNALLALETRHAATDALKEKVARRDLISNATCEMRKDALMILEKIGRSSEAVSAIETAIARGAVENSCMASNLPVVLRVVRERRQE